MREVADYSQTFREYLLPFKEKMFEDDWVYQQEGGSIHRATASEEWVTQKNIRVMEWPARGLDLNPIENVWKILSIRVYAHGRQFSRVRYLKQCILLKWSKMDQTLPYRLVYIMRKRSGRSGKAGKENRVLKIARK